MGQWSLERLVTRSSPLDGQIFGTNFYATYHLKYTASTFGSFQELPKLDWHETIMMNEYHNHQSWVFDTNMYEHNPCSKTLIVWARRYIESYKKACNLPRSPNEKGFAELKKLNGMPVTAQDLGAGITTPQGQADAVRSYLKKKGGYLTIEIHDIPGINTPTAGQHKERLLLFDVGVVGLPLRAKAEQYLNVDANVLVANWGRRFSNSSWTRGKLTTTGLTNGPPPPLVANPRAPTFFPGECW